MGGGGKFASKSVGPVPSLDHNESQSAAGTSRSFRVPDGYLQHYGLQRKSGSVAAGLPAGYRDYYGLGAAKPGGEEEGKAANAIAADGTQGAAERLPHRDCIQASFGRHDVSGVSAHVGGAAAKASAALGAKAYAQGNSVAFAGSPSLHTAAHEAAHVVQQRAGVHLQGGVGEAGDSYERHADSVADLVVQGRSAEALLDHGGVGTAPTGAVGMALQRQVTPPPDSRVDGDSKMVNSNRGDPAKFAHLMDGKVGSGYRKVYQAGGHEALVFLPEAGIESPVEVFVFFHGHDADYGVDKMNKFEKSGDNPAQGMHIAESVTKGRPNVIAIL